jgi:hypothetical protein
MIEHDGYASVAHRNHGETQGTRRLYTSSGLWRVKPYVQFLIVFDLIMAKVEVVCGVYVPRDALARLILGDGPGRWTGVRVGYIRETYL